MTGAMCTACHPFTPLSGCLSLSKVPRQPRSGEKEQMGQSHGQDGAVEATGKCLGLREALRADSCWVLWPPDQRPLAPRHRVTLIRVILSITILMSCLCTKIKLRVHGGWAAACSAPGPPGAASALWGPGGVGGSCCPHAQRGSSPAESQQRRPGHRGQRFPTRRRRRDTLWSPPGARPGPGPGSRKQNPGRPREAGERGPSTAKQAERTPLGAPGRLPRGSSTRPG